MFLCIRFHGLSQLQASQASTRLAKHRAELREAPALCPRSQERADPAGAQRCSMRNPGANPNGQGEAMEPIFSYLLFSRPGCEAWLGFGRGGRCLHAPVRSSRDWTRQHSVPAAPLAMKHTPATAQPEPNRSEFATFQNATSGGSETQFTQE